MSHFQQQQDAIEVGGIDVWGKAWTTEDIRGASRQWTLAGDSGLLNHMQEFAQQMISQTHNVQHDVDALMQECKATDSRVYNVVNDFLMLSNTQFVENRVYDEEIQDKALERKAEQLDLKIEDKEEELIGKVMLALGFGLSSVLSGTQLLKEVPDVEEAHEFECDDRERILQISDPYDRDLPYVIGTEAFLRDDCVGLRFLKRGYSEASANERNDIKDLTADNAAQVDFQENGPAVSNIASHSTDNTEIDIEEPDICIVKISSIEDNLSNKSTAFEDFASELDTKLTVVPGEASNEQKCNSDTENAPKLVHSGNSDDLFKDDQDEGESPFGKSKFFSSNKGLFDEAESEDDLFCTTQYKGKLDTTAKIKESITSIKKSEHDIKPKPAPSFNSQSLFGDEDDALDLFPALAVKAETSNRAAESANGSLFNDERRLFNVPAQKSTNAKSKNHAEAEAKKKVADAGKKASLFDDDGSDANDSNLFSSTKISEGFEIKEDTKLRSKSLFEDEDILFGPQTDNPEVDLFRVKPVATAKIKENSPKKSGEKTMNMETSSRVSNIFDESGRDDKLLNMLPLAKAQAEKPTGMHLDTEEVLKCEATPSKTPEPVIESPRKKLPDEVAALSGILLPGIAASPLLSRRLDNAPKVYKLRDQPIQIFSETDGSETIHCDDRPAVITFEEPPTLETLHSTNKERIKIQVKRRPPSRKGRQEALRKSAIDIIPTASRKQSVTPPALSSKSEPTSPLLPAHSPHHATKLTAASPSTEEEDLFSVGGTTPGSVSKDFGGLFASSRLLAESPTKGANGVFSTRRIEEDVAKTFSKMM